MTENPLLMVDDLVENMSQERHLLAAFRALKKVGIEAQWNDEGGITIVDEDLYDLDSLEDNDEFVAAFIEELKRMVAGDMFRRMVHAGTLEIDGFDEEGEPIYVLAKEVV